MRYITDTDFLPDVRDVSYDVYQLLYGVVVNGIETRIYDTVISLCRKYREPLLRNAKINAWKQAVKGVLTTLSEKVEEDKNTEVFIPFVSLHCSVERLANLYTFALNVLNEVYGLDIADLIRRNKASAEEVKEFYPIPRLSDLMQHFADKCRDQNGLGEAAACSVEEEIVRRGFGGNSSSIPTESTYRATFLNEASLPTIAYEQQEDESPKKGGSEEYLVKVGYLYYALKHYLNAVKPQATKDSVRKQTEQAAIRIAHGLYKPNEYFASTDMGSETFYRYVHFKRFNDVSTDAGQKNYAEIERLLTKYRLSQPDEPLKKTKGSK